MLARDPERLASAVGRVQKDATGPDPWGRSVDVAGGDVNGVFDAIGRRFGPIDALCTFAGVIPPYQEVAALDDGLAVPAVSDASGPTRKRFQVARQKRFESNAAGEGASIGAWVGGVAGFTLFLILAAMGWTFWAAPGTGLLAMGVVTGLGALLGLAFAK